MQERLPFLEQNVLVLDVARSLAVIVLMVRY